MPIDNDKEVEENIQKYVKSLLRGKAVVIDDGIAESAATDADGKAGVPDRINTIIEKMESENGTCFVKKRTPDYDDCRNALFNASFVILDWKFPSSSSESKEPGARLPEGVAFGSEHETLSDDDNVMFISQIMKEFYVPVMIVSNKAKDEIKDILDRGNTTDSVPDDKKDAYKLCYEAKESGRVQIYEKKEFGEKTIPDFLTEWLRESVTVRVYLYLNELIQKAKNNFFKAYEESSPKWPLLVYNILAADNYATDAEFQDFVLSLFSSWMEPLGIERIFTDKDKEFKPDGTNISNIYWQIKHQDYLGENNEGLKPSCGDLYIRDDISGEDMREGTKKTTAPKYLLNITAPCDLRRPEHLFITGDACNAKEEEASRKKKKNKEGDKSSLFTDQDKLYSEYIIPRFDGNDTVKFLYSSYYKQSFKAAPGDSEKFDALTYKGYRYERKCRLVHPYISAIQDRFSYYIVRHGLPREPDL